MATARCEQKFDRRAARSRAAYKLLELAQRFRLIGSGDHVVDLGAWPGGWLQVAAELVGPRGIVVGVDLVPIDPLPQAWVSTVVGDAGGDRRAAGGAGRAPADEGVQRRRVGGPGPGPPGVHGRQAHQARVEP